MARSSLRRDTNRPPGPAGVWQELSPLVPTVCHVRDRGLAFRGQCFPSKRFGHTDYGNAGTRAHGGHPACVLLQEGLHTAGLPGAASLQPVGAGEGGGALRGGGQGRDSEGRLAEGPWGHWCCFQKHSEKGRLRRRLHTGATPTAGYYVAMQASVWLSWVSACCSATSRQAGRADLVGMWEAHGLYLPPAGQRAEGGHFHLTFSPVEQAP